MTAPSAVEAATALAQSPALPSAVRAVLRSLLETIEEQGARLTGDVRKGTIDGERCHRCGGENVVWVAPSPLWNLVMRGNDINGDPLYDDLVCMRCFAVLADDAGVTGHHWRLYVEPEPDGLIRTTPTGRWWNYERWMWEPARLAARHTVSVTKQHPADHGVFDCPCGEAHCKRDPAVSECVDSGVFARWHCDDYECQACISEAEREMYLERRDTR